MSLHFSARHNLGDFQLDANFQTTAGVTALFGPSGSGKTSILKMIAGLINPQHGEISVGEQKLFSSSEKIAVAPNKREIGYVFQEPRLFPHLTVQQNLRYGAYMRGRSPLKSEVDKIVDVLGISHLMKRKPHGLSGGEQQRISIGRALFSSPKLLLMDEPLASLDQNRKSEILPYLEALCEATNTPILYVSHSMSEVMQLADSIIVLESGKVKAASTPKEFYQNNAVISAFERSELGTFIQGTVTAFNAENKIGTISFDGVEIHASAHELKIGERVRLFIAARDVMLSLHKLEGISALNVLPAKVGDIQHAASGHVNVALNASGIQLVSQITAASANRLALTADQPLYAIIKATALEAL